MQRISSIILPILCLCLSACALEYEMPDRDELVEGGQIDGSYGDDLEEGDDLYTEDDDESVMVENRAALGISRDKVETKVGSRTVQLRAFIRDLAIGGTGFKSVGGTLKIENAIRAKKRRGYEVDIKCVYFSKTEKRFPGDEVRIVEFPAADFKSSTSDRKTTCAERWGGIGVKVNNDGSASPAEGGGTTVFPSGVVAIATVRKGSSCKTLVAKSGKLPDNATSLQSVRDAIRCELVE